MAFGLSFGKSKTKQTETTNQVKTGTQAQTGTNTTTTTGSQTTKGSQSTSSTGSSSTTSGTTGTQTQTGTTSNFSNPALSAIDSKVGDFISQVLGGGGAATARQELGDFDANAFIESTMQAARQQANDQLSEGTLGLVDQVGGSSGENSAVALLRNRMENATGASLAGVQANAVKTAQEIGASRAGTIMGAETGAQNALAQVLNAIKGGTQTTTGTTASNQQQTANTNTSENQNTQSQQQTDSTQTALEIINQLLSTNETLAGTTTSKGTKSGGGASLSL